MASPAGAKPDEQGAPIAHRLLREAVSTQKLSKEFIALCKLVRDEAEERTVSRQSENVFKELSLLEFQARRHLLADQANAQDQQLYETKQAQLEHEIEQASQLLESSKIKLQTAREEKKRKLQYEERRLKCKQYPKRSTTAAEIEAVHQEIEVLQAETGQAVQEYEVHEKRFAVLTRFIDELEASLNPDEAIIGEQSRPGNVADQSDRDSCDRSVMQE
ncbi:hypothetical protein WJX82_001170 [Trebouxia sp. C0006]